MDLKIKLEQLHQKVIGLKDQIGTEEATKNAFVMPFIQILGYDIFNPTEVVPEHVCDIGTKKGEKVDYVIRNNDELHYRMQTLERNCRRSQLAAAPVLSCF